MNVCIAQNPDIKRTFHWYFGHGAGIDFSSGTAVADTTGSLHTYEGCGVMSDTSGNLLFYTDGDTVWNKLHQPMQNGFGLNGCGNYNGSSTQGGLVIPFPNDPDSMFYIFTTDCSENNFISGLDYSIINLKLNNGLGDVVSKNTLLLQNGTEGLACTRKANGCGYFLLTHEHNSSNFIIYSIDSNGVLLINTQNIGPFYNDWITSFKFSNDGRFLSCSSATEFDAVAQFNNSTGVISNYIILQCSNFGGVYSSYRSAFSASNKKLYFDGYGNYFFQYSLDVYDSILICNSCVILFEDSVYSQSIVHPSLGPDGKIYFDSYLYNDSLTTIENPDSTGFACNLSLFSFDLKRESLASFPNFVSTYLSHVILQALIQTRKMTIIM
jgi:hypothetical protein